MFGASGIMMLYPCTFLLRSLAQAWPLNLKLCTETIRAIIGVTHTCDIIFAIKQRSYTPNAQCCPHTNACIPVDHPRTRDKTACAFAIACLRKCSRLLTRKRRHMYDALLALCDCFLQNRATASLAIVQLGTA